GGEFRRLATFRGRVGGGDSVNPPGNPPHANPDDAVLRTRNLSRYFVEHREIAWVALAAVCAWGIYGYVQMPQRRDPDVPNKQAVVVTTWPGESAEKVEQLVTKPIEKTIASQSSVARIESVSRSDVSIVT